MVALVCGGADTVFQDYARAETLVQDAGLPFPTIIAVNDVGTKLPRVDHWASLHPDRLPGWERKRGGPKTWQTWTHYDTFGLCDNLLDHEGGTSGGFGVTVALHLGAERVILCGVPLLSRHTHYFGSHQPFDEAGRFREEWVENGLVEKWQGRVKSCSGWTAEVMGQPSVDWLREPFTHAHTRVDCGIPNTEAA